jgi:hypothetical protein
MVVSNDENVKNMLINLNSQDQNNCLDLWPICLISKPCTFESLDLELARFMRIKNLNDGWSNS